MTLFLLEAPPARAWQITNEHNVGGPAFEATSSMGVDGLGNVYLFGSIGSVAPSSQLLLAKYAPLGPLLWQRVLPASVPVIAFGMAVEPAGGAYFVAGYGTSGGCCDSGILGEVLANGSLGFVRSFPFVPEAVGFDPSTGGAVVTGYAFAPSGYGPGFVAAFAATGAARWIETTNAAGVAIGRRVTVDASGDIYVALTLVGSYDSGIAEFSRTGVPLSQLYLTQPSALAVDVALDPSGNVFMASLASYQSILSRFNASLVPQWASYLSSTTAEQWAMRLLPAADGSLYLLAEYLNSSAAVSGSSIVHVSGSGGVLEDEVAAQPDANGSMGFSDVALQADGSVLLAGDSFGTPPRNFTRDGSFATTAVPGSWVPLTLPWSANSSATSAFALAAYDAGLPVDDFNSSYSAQAWWCAVSSPPDSLGVTVTASYDVPVSSNLTVGFVASVSGGTPPYTYRWAFGDGSFNASAQPTHLYPGWDTYPAQLWVNDSLGHRGYGYAQVFLVPPPVASFVVSPASGDLNTTFAVDGSASHDRVNASNPIQLRWDWNSDGIWDTAWTSSPLASHQYTTAGNYTIRLEVLDTHGLANVASQRVTVHGPPPVVSASLSGTLGLNGWYRSPVNVTLAAATTQNPVASVWVRINAGPWHATNGTVYRQRFAADGNYTLDYYAVDSVGDVGSIESTGFKIDTRGPVLTVLTPGGAETSSTMVLSWNGVDKTSGIGGYEVFTDGSLAWSGLNSSLDLHLSDGSHEVEIRATDRAGNQVASFLNLTVDTNPFSLSGPYRGAPTFLIVIAAAAIAGAVVWLRRRRRDGPPSTASGARDRPRS